MVHNKGVTMNKSNKVIKYAIFAYWDKLQASQNESLKRLIEAKPYTMYGENQDFVNATVSHCMPSIGYVRSETVSVYFREYKAKCRRVRETLNAKLGGI